MTRRISQPIRPRSPQDSEQQADDDQVQPDDLVGAVHPVAPEHGDRAASSRWTTKSDRVRSHATKSTPIAAVGTPHSTRTVDLSEFGRQCGSARDARASPP